MKSPVQLTAADLDLVFPDPVEPMADAGVAKLSWDDWMCECADRTAAYLRSYDRRRDPGAVPPSTRFSLRGYPEGDAH
jgi:hypothetical protein